MCVNDIYTDIYPDGRKQEYSRPNLCSASRHGQTCEHTVVYNHPARPLQYGEQSSAFLYPNQLPPTPRQSPRASTPIIYHSGNESDRSRQSNNSEKKRSSGVYVNGQKVLDLNKKRHARNERIVIVDSPPTPRTPPRQFAMPYTAPPSPNANIPQFQYNIVEAQPHRESLRPVIVDERPRPHVSIEVVDHAHHGHRRQHSNDSRHSRSSAMSDEERRRRRHAEREDRQRAEDEVRRQKIRAKIAAANEAIKRRPAVPVPPAPLQRASTALNYKRPAVEIAMPLERSREKELVDAVRQLNISERILTNAERRARENREKDEEEAQRRRLLERMMPRRRATVGPGSRRHRVLYDDGLYRWE